MIPKSRFGNPVFRSVGKGGIRGMAQIPLLRSPQRGIVHAMDKAKDSGFGGLKPIGCGRTATLYEGEPGRVIKVYKEWFQPDWVRNEAEIGRMVFAAGVPAPEVFEETVLDGKPAVVYQRIEGESLLRYVGRKPFGIAAHAQLMATLQAEIHRHEAPGLPSQKEKISSCLDYAGDLLTEPVRERFNKQLDAMPGGNRVCHGDFHPDNIMVTPAGTVAIDWGNAWRGDPLTDAARTWLMFSTPYRIPGRPLMVALLEIGFRKKMRDTWLRHYCHLTGFRREDVLALVPLMAAARLHENVPAEREWLLELIDEKGTI